MTQACAQQHDDWSCGVYVASFLSMVLQRRATTHQIDPASDKNDMISILRSAELDGAFSDEEKEALRGLQKDGGGRQQISFEDRLARCGLETLSQRLQVARQRLTEATKDLARACEEVSKLSGRLEARGGDRIHHDGVRLGAECMLDHMQNFWLNLDKELTAANERKALADSAAEDALKEMEACHNAVMAKTDHDKLVRAQAELDKCRARHEVWKAADMDGEVSLPES
ncbi:hypothetical protein ACJZ2D_016617 [Fusarium nematophilum]